MTAVNTAADHLLSSQVFPAFSFLCHRFDDIFSFDSIQPHTHTQEAKLRALETVTETGRDPHDVRFFPFSPFCLAGLVTSINPFHSIPIQFNQIQSQEEDEKNIAALDKQQLAINSLQLQKSVSHGFFYLLFFFWEPNPIQSICFVVDFVAITPDREEAAAGHRAPIVVPNVSQPGSEL